MVRSIPLIWTTPFTPTTENVVVFRLERLTSAIETRGKERPTRSVLPPQAGRSHPRRASPSGGDAVPNSGLRGQEDAPI